MPAGLLTGIRSLAFQRAASSFLDPFFTQRSNLSQTLTPILEMGTCQPPPRRPFCLKCSKPTCLCLCVRIKSPPLDNSILVTILQHSREKNHPLNSTRVASLGLKNLNVVSVTDVNFRAQFSIRALNPSPNREVGSKLDLKIGSFNGDTNGLLQKNAEENGGNMGIDLFNCQKQLEVMGSEQVPISMSDAESNGVALDTKCRFGNLHNQVDELELERITAPPTKEISIFGTEANGGIVRSPLSETHQQKQDFVLKTSATFNKETLNAQTATNCLQETQPQLEKSDCDHVEESPTTEDTVTTTSAKCSVTCTPSHLLISLERTAEPDLSWVLATPIGIAATSNGFIVKKLQRKQLSGSLEFEDFEEFEIVIPPGSALLFPSKKSIGLEAVDFEVRHLVVLDGTWAKARRMYYENPWLNLLPHLRLDLKKTSLYSEVRHQPKAGCLSTIESIVCAFKVLGDNMEGLDNLLDVFESMVGDQRRCKNEKFSRMSQS